MALVSKNFSDIITFTRASTATYFDSAGVLQSAAINAPRFDYNPSTLAAQGLLIEESRANLLTYSDDFGNAAWTKSGSTVSTDTTTAPTGTVVADSLIEDTSTGQHRTFRNATGTTNTNPYTFSVFAKANTRTRIYLGIAEGTTFVRQGNAVFDLSAGTVVSAGGGSGGATGGSATITAVGNGWYRCTYTLTLGGTDTTVFSDINLVSTGTTISYTGNGTSGLFLWGAQLEAGAFPTSYIPTTTTALTRAVDVASVNTLNPWFNQTEGSVYVELQSLSPLTPAQSVALGKFPTAYLFEAGASDSNLLWYGVGAEVFIAGTYNNLGTVPSGINKFAVSMAPTAGQSRSSLNGAAAVNRSGTLSGTVTQLILGGGSTTPGNSVLNGWLRRFTYYPRALSAAELPVITA